MRKHLFAALLLAVAATLGRAASNDPNPTRGVVIVNDPDRTTTAFRVAVGVADSTTIAALTSSNPASGTTAMADYIINGRQTIDLEAVFTASSQTCVVDVLFEYESPAGTVAFTRWGGPKTLTGSAKPGNGGTGNATDPGQTWSTGGATNCRFVVTTAAASGTVSLYPVSY